MGLARLARKSERWAYRTVDGHVRIGSVVHGIGAEVRDPDGWVWTLVEAMDGTRVTRADEPSTRLPRTNAGPCGSTAAVLVTLGGINVLWLVTWWLDRRAADRRTR
ncbi:hypothetical protein [Streptomyces sp. NPDC058985]|uniref:hypothetical protein n=1 Tax=Streptomyces sp. NPDC058985 TaxID=3346684 RepID=UPI0036AC0081